MAHEHFAGGGIRVTAEGAGSDAAWFPAGQLASVTIQQEFPQPGERGALAGVGVVAAFCAWLEFPAHWRAIALFVLAGCAFWLVQSLRRGSSYLVVLTLTSGAMPVLLRTPKLEEAVRCARAVIDAMPGRVANKDASHRSLPTKPNQLSLLLAPVLAVVGCVAAFFVRCDAYMAGQATENRRLDAAREADAARARAAAVEKAAAKEAAEREEKAMRQAGQAAMDRIEKMWRDYGALPREKQTTEHHTELLATTNLVADKTPGGYAEQVRARGQRLARIHGTLAERAAEVKAALVLPDSQGVCHARVPLAALTVAERRDPVVAGALAELSRREQALLEQLRRDANAGRQLLCGDGTTSGCPCAGSHRGCCSHHRGVVGCEPMPQVRIDCR